MFSVDMCKSRYASNAFLDLLQENAHENACDNFFWLQDQVALFFGGQNTSPESQVLNCLCLPLVYIQSA